MVLLFVPAALRFCSHGMRFAPSKLPWEVGGGGGKPWEGSSGGALAFCMSPPRARASGVWGVLLIAHVMIFVGDRRPCILYCNAGTERWAGFLSARPRFNSLES